MTALIAIPSIEHQPIDWKVIEDGIFDMVVAALDLSDEQVIWGNQDIPQPGYPYVSMLKIAGPSGEYDGRPEVRVEDTADAGEESRQISYMPVLFTVSFSAHVDEKAGAYDPRLNAIHMMSKLQASLTLLSVQTALAQSGLSWVRDEGVLDTSVEANATWLSRATLDVIFRTASVIEERDTIIEQVELTPQAPGQKIIIDGS